MNAQEFIEIIMSHVEVEAAFTEANNEDRWPMDYLADLHTRLGRIMAGDLSL